MEVREMREFISKKYSTIRGVKIKDVPDNQIMAIYFRMTNTSSKPKKKNNYHQMNLEEYKPTKKKEAIEYAWEEGENKDFSPKIKFTQMSLFDMM